MPPLYVGMKKKKKKIGGVAVKGNVYFGGEGNLFVGTLGKLGKMN